jgi:hypothetical protein
MAVGLALPLLAYGCCGWFFSRVQAAMVAVVILLHCALLLAASGGGDDRAVHVIIIVVVLSTLFSLWHTIAEAGYLSKGWGGQWLGLADAYSPILAPFLFLLIPWLLVWLAAAAIIASIVHF